MVDTDLSLDDVMEVLYESFEEHKDWYNNYEDLMSSYLDELKRFCETYHVKNYDEKILYYKLANLFSTRNHYSA